MSFFLTSGFRTGMFCIIFSSNFVFSIFSSSLGSFTFSLDFSSLGLLIGWFNFVSSFFFSTGSFCSSIFLLICGTFVFSAISINSTCMTGGISKSLLLNNGKDKTVNKSIKTCRNIDPRTETLIYK